jgi:HEAT repeat protein
MDDVRPDIHEPETSPGFEEEPLTGPEEPTERLTPPRVIVRFFGIPLLLVLAVVGLYAFFGWLLGTQKSPEDLLKDLRSAYPSTREHALYDLTYTLQTHPELRNDDRFLQALMEQYRRRQEFRPEIRVYLALALGHLARPESLTVLREGLADSDPRMVFYTIWAIGRIGQPEAGAWLVPFAEHPDDGIREMAVYALGNLRYAPARDVLIRRLDDTNPSVRMNAVLALAQLQAPEALSGLRQLSRRDYLRGLPRMDAVKAEGILLNVIQVADAYAADPELRQNIERLARSDESLKVRNAALDWLRRHGSGKEGNKAGGQ